MTNATIGVLMQGVFTKEFRSGIKGLNHSTLWKTPQP